MYDADCRRCPLHETTENVCVAGVGNADADILLYGDTPNTIGDEVLDEVLTRVGLTRDDIYISNTVRCQPPDNRSPFASEQKACRTFTASELATVTPKVIVALGGAPLKALTGLNAVGKARGRSQRLHRDYRTDIPVIATWQPSMALHQPGMRQTIVEDLVSDLKAAKHAAGEDEEMDFVRLSPLKPDSYKRFAACTEMAVDLEWEVLPDGTKKGGGWPWSQRKGKKPRLVNIGMAAREEDGTVISLSAPWEGAKPSIQKALKLVIERVPSIYHFGTADVVWLMDKGIKPVVSGDTFVLATLLNINTGLALGTLAATMLPDLPTWKSEGDDVKGHWPSTPQEWATLLLYNAKDCAVTLLLHERLMQMVVEREREAILPLYRKVLAPAIRAFSQMALDGARLDPELLETGRQEVVARISALEMSVAEMVGMPGRREVTRGDALAPLVEKLLHIEFPKTPKTQKPSMTIDTLYVHKGKHPVVDTLIELSETKTQLNRYYGPWSALLEAQGDGRLHTVYKLTEARTGRTSAMGERGATMQQYPHGAMRRMVSASPGYTLVLADESQVELRIGAWVANEPTMMKFLNEGMDLHTVTAGWFKAVNAGVSIEAYMENPEPFTSTVTKEQRTAAKIPNFAYLYGGQEGVAIDTARQQYGIELDFESAKRMRDGYFTLYSHLLTWHSADGARDFNRGYCESPLGRRRYAESMPGEDYNGMVRKYINTPVQATASDLTMAALVLVYEEVESLNLDVRYVGFVHDSIMLEVRNDHVILVADIVKNAMENPMLDELHLSLPVPLRADVEVGDNWADAKELAFA